METVRALKPFVYDSHTGITYAEGDIFKVATERVQELVELGIVAKSTAKTDSEKKVISTEANKEKVEIVEVKEKKQIEK